MLGHRTLNPEEYFSILKRRGWIIAIPTLILPIFAVGITFFLTPKYVSQTLVLVEPQTVPDNYVKPVVSEDLTGRLASMQEQILSRSRLEPIIERFNLYGSSKMAMDDRIALARKNIALKPIHSDIERTGGLPGFFISFEASDARTAQLVCGEIESLFVSQNLHSREQAAQDTTDFLKEQLDSAKRSLDDQDAKLAVFQRKYFGSLPGEEQSNMNVLQSLNVQLDATTQALARMEQEKSYGEVILSQQQRDIQATSQLQPKASPQTQQSELQRLQALEADLKTRYTDDYPDVVAVQHKIEALRRQMAEAPPPAPVASTSVTGSPAPMANEPLALQQLRAQLHAQDQAIAQKKQAEGQIQAQIRMYQGRIQSSPDVQEQFKALTRDYQTAQRFYDELLTKMNQSKMATDLERRQQGEQFRVMDPPNLPEAPTFPKRGAFLAMGIAAGFGLGLLIAALLEYRDTSLRSERDIWAFTKLPTLAVIGLVTGEEHHHSPRKKPRSGRSQERLGSAGDPLMGLRG